MLNSKEVTEIFMDSLFQEEEVIDGKPTSDPVTVCGIIVNIGFHKERLESHKETVANMLSDLPEDFQSTEKGGGGGQSFLNMCLTKTGEQWTGSHQVMEQLCLMAIGLGLGKFPLSKEFWVALPGKMPYFSVL